MAYSLSNEIDGTLKKLLAKNIEELEITRRPLKIRALLADGHEIIVSIRGKSLEPIAMIYYLNEE